ncbi:hypothetical protein [Pseudonocardia parietis]|uniref:Uncharacterized protein n=1 Tax=Pseudonocardia parietis TaxID=570936 RepID=A0ABS4W441_9PSEU|nr:hypothetical protein [Pseudonocardia parietis]MBP2370688.1 hypothetical protein [Pseudonocardia parietis]
MTAPDLGALVAQYQDLAARYDALTARYEDLAAQSRQATEDLAVETLRVDLLEIGFEVADERHRAGMCPRCAVEVST